MKMRNIADRPNRTTVGIDIDPEEFLVVSAGMCMTSICLNHPEMAEGKPFVFDSPQEQEVYLSCAITLIKHLDAGEKFMKKMHSIISNCGSN
jgi:hypothetical protein